MLTSLWAIIFVVWIIWVMVRICQAFFDLSKDKYVFWVVPCIFGVIYFTVEFFATGGFFKLVLAGIWVANIAIQMKNPDFDWKKDRDFVLLKKICNFKVISQEERDRRNEQKGE